MTVSGDTDLLSGIRSMLLILRVAQAILSTVSVYVWCVWWSWYVVGWRRCSDEIAVILTSTNSCREVHVVPLSVDTYMMLGWPFTFCPLSVRKRAPDYNMGSRRVTTSRPSPHRSHHIKDSARRAGRKHRHDPACWRHVQTRPQHGYSATAFTLILQPS